MASQQQQIKAVKIVNIEERKAGWLAAATTITGGGGQKKKQQALELSEIMRES